MPSLRRVASLLYLALAITAQSCAPDSAPDGVKRATKTGGPTILFDLEKQPLPDLPLPNDVGTWPDPTSRTGKRINVSVIAPTAIERAMRDQFDRLEGWGTYAPITIPFDRPLDVGDVAQRMKDDDFDFGNDPVYLVNLSTGVPVPLDLGQDMPLTLRNTDRYWPNDPLKTESNLLFDTHEEDANGNGRMDPGEDTDFDGVLDHPNFLGGTRPDNGVDGLLTFWESETNTLVLRPLLPLDEMTEYAVVVTDRLHGADPSKLPVQSPFDFIHHPSQRASTQRLVDVLDRRIAYYGWSTSDEVMQHVQFVFTFTTEPTKTDLYALRDGVWGQGKLSWIADEYPAEMRLFEAVGNHDPADPDPPDMFTCTSPEPAARVCAACAEQGEATRYVGHVTPSMKQSLDDVVAQVFGFSGPQGKRIVDSFDSVAYVAVGTMKVPWLLGDVNDVSPLRTMEWDHDAGTIAHTTDTVQFLVVVPKTTDRHKPPFPVALYGHGYTGAGIEGLGFAGELARHGVATIAMNAPGHGLELSEGDKSLAESIFRGGCLTPFALGLEANRVRDLNGDGVTSGESGGDMLTSYIFHTRDMIRQGVVERMMMIRALRAFDGRRYDWKGNGSPSLAGDFDEDGVIDLGGPTVGYFGWGESLGGLLSGIQGGVDHNLTAVAPVAGGGSLTDIGVRTFQPGVVEAVQMRLMSPLIISVPAEARIDYQKDASGQPVLGDDGKPIAKPKDQQTRTICDPGQRSIRFFVVDLNAEREIEIACTNEDEIADGMDVVVANTSAGKVRCAKVTAVNSDFAGTAQFRIGVPASVGDKLYFAAYSPPDGEKQAVRAYGDDCTPLPGAKLAKEITSFQGIGDEPCPDDASGARCIDYDARVYPVGSRLVSVAEGYGVRRQSPDLRKLATLAQIALDPADPITFAPYYYVKPKLDPFGNPAPPTAILTIDTIGDQNVPIDAGIAQARVHGAVPFLRPDNPAAHDYPDYVAPQKLIDLLGGKTPNQVLLDEHVIEGIARLGRHPAAATCAPNVNASIAGCPADAPYPDRTVCDDALFDVENLSEGSIPFHPQTLGQPLRLVRIAKPATEAELSSIWGPRLSQPWTPSAALGATLQPYIVPEGVHGFLPPDPCKQWDDGAYLSNILGHFFRSGGKDLYYASHPTIDPTKPDGDHRCAAVTDPSKGCDWGD